jgi:hypothetical protein
MLGEGRHHLQIFQRGDGTAARLAHVATAQLHREGIGGAETVGGIVAGRTGKLARSRKRRIEKEGPTERAELPCLPTHLGT